jgi:octaprenyl-diphosphate synthase
MAEFQQEALLLLDIYPDFKDALILMVNYVIERKNNSILSF